MRARAGRVLLAKTSLDGHWRGLSIVGRGLRDHGFEVVMLGAATADEIASAALQEDVDLVGLNVGGRIEVVERVVTAVRSKAPGLPIFAGGTLTPGAVAMLKVLGIPAFPPGSSIESIVQAARDLVRDSTTA
jgi:methylmalonyl-CoA mutase, C-terminal domain